MDKPLTVVEDLDELRRRLFKSLVFIAQLIKCGAIPVDLGIAKDKLKEIRYKIMMGLKKDLDILLNCCARGSGDV